VVATTHHICFGQPVRLALIAKILVCPQAWADGMAVFQADVNTFSTTTRRMPLFCTCSFPELYDLFTLQEWPP
jgi:hypothetical protein